MSAPAADGPAAQQPGDSSGSALLGLTPITVPLRSRRRERALIAQKIQHVIPAMALFLVGMQAVKDQAHGGELALAVVQLVTSAGLVINFLRAVRAARQPLKMGSGPKGAAGHPEMGSDPKGAAAHEHHGVDWFEIFAAGVLYAEAFEKWHLKHRMPNATLLTATVTLVLGLQHGKLAARRARHRVMRVDDHGIRVGGRFWQTFDVPWKDIAAIELTPRTAAIRPRRGRARRLNLADLHHGDEARRTLETARAHLATLQPPPPVDRMPKLS